MLGSWGVAFESLPTSSSKQADYLATHDDFRVLIEEKVKLESADSALRRDETYAGGEVHSSVLPLVHDNRLSGIVRHGAAQLASSSLHFAPDARVIWLTGVGYGGKAKFHQFVATLYGSTRIISVDAGHDVKFCYFFRNNEFFTHRDTIDGAVAAYLTRDSVVAVLCLNPFSRRWEALRDSWLAKQFGPNVHDPAAEERTGEAYLVDGPVDRSDPEKVLAYLQTKYRQPRLMKIDMSLYSASVVIPAQDDDREGSHLVRRGEV